MEKDKIESARTSSLFLNIEPPDWEYLQKTKLFNKKTMKQTIIATSLAVALSISAFSQSSANTNKRYAKGKLHASVWFSVISFGVYKNGQNCANYKQFNTVAAISLVPVIAIVACELSKLIFKKHKNEQKFN